MNTIKNIFLLGSLFLSPLSLFAAEVKDAGTAGSDSVKVRPTSPVVPVAKRTVEFVFPSISKPDAKKNIVINSLKTLKSANVLVRCKAEPVSTSDDKSKTDHSDSDGNIEKWILRKQSKILENQGSIDRRLNFLISLGLQSDLIGEMSVYLGSDLMTCALGDDLLTGVSDSGGFLSSLSCVKACLANEPAESENEYVSLDAVLDDDNITDVISENRQKDGRGLSTPFIGFGDKLNTYLSLRDGVQTYNKVEEKTKVNRGHLYMIPVISCLYTRGASDSLDPKELDNFKLGLQALLSIKIGKSTLGQSIFEDNLSDVSKSIDKADQTNILSLVVDSFSSLAGSEVLNYAVNYLLTLRGTVKIEKGDLITFSSNKNDVLFG